MVLTIIQDFLDMLLFLITIISENLAENVYSNVTAWDLTIAIWPQLEIAEPLLMGFAFFALVIAIQEEDYLNNISI